MEFGNGIPLLDIARVAERSTKEDFAAELGPAFVLIHSLDLSGAGSADTNVETVVHSSQEKKLPTPTALVFPIKRAEGSTFEFVSVGRHANNDICLPHESVSRFHAYFKAEGDDFALQDAKSNNGTRINGAHAPAQGEGEAVPVRSGDALRFGDVVATFISAGQLLRLALGLPPD